MRPIGKAPISRQNTLSTTRRYHNSYNRGRKSPPYFQDYEASLKQNHNRIFLAEPLFLSFYICPVLFQYP